MLRPALGRADRRAELDELLELERRRANEAKAEIYAFQKELIGDEVAAARAHAQKVAVCFDSVVAILDR